MSFAMSRHRDVPTSREAGRVDLFMCQLMATSHDANEVVLEERLSADLGTNLFAHDACFQIHRALSQ